MWDNPGWWSGDVSGSTDALSLWELASVAGWSSPSRLSLAIGHCLQKPVASRSKKLLISHRHGTLMDPTNHANQGYRYRVVPYLSAIEGFAHPARRESAIRRTQVTKWVNYNIYIYLPCKIMVDLQNSKPKVTHPTTRLPPVVTDRDQLVTGHLPGEHCYVVAPRAVQCCGLHIPKYPLVI